MVTERFKESIKKLNNEQKKAVDAIEGAVMVIAGPGTGKTQILTLRIANILLETDTSPENILALTFTESGVYAMRKRLVDIIGTPAYKVELNTFHGFCNDLIRNNPEDFPNFISSNNAEDIEQIQIIEEIINKKSLVILKPFGDPLHYVKPALSAISDLKKEGITVEKFEEAVAQDEEDFKKIDDLYHEKGAYIGKMKSHYEKRLKNINKNKELTIIYREYQNSLHEKRVYDFNDMLLEVIKAFEKNQQLLLRTQEQYQYILVDEHQDSNAAQNKIIELLCNFHPNPNLFVVGDEKQSIYRFQGASLENFLYFKKLYPEALLINLRENYRSAQIILDASGKVISNNLLASEFMPENANLIAKSEHENKKIKIIETTDFYSEYYFLADSIKNKISQGVQPKEIAILAKENKDISPFIDIFEQESIPFVVESNQNILQDVEIQKLILLFNAVYNFGSEEDLLKVLHVDCLEINPVDVVRLIHMAHQEKTTVWEILNTQAYKKIPSLKSQVQIEKFYTNLIQWKVESQNERFDFLFKNMINNSGLLKTLLSKRNSLQNLDKITGFYEEIKQRIDKNPSFNLGDFMSYLALLKKHEVSIKKHAKTTHKNAVHLMTAHKSKGLEFDIVYIINAFDGHWGNQRRKGSKFTLPWEYLKEKLIILTDEEKNEDERRLFYVALTRARKEIIVSYSTRAIDGKERVPSQFIEEILETYKELENIEEFEKKFLDNKQIILNPFDKNNRTDIGNEYLANKELFAEMFARKGFAATHLNNYIECPWRYFFRNLLAVPEAMSKSAMFGSAIHQALSAFIKRSNEKASLPLLLTYYNEALLKQPLTEQEIVELKQKGKIVLEGYYNEHVSTWSNNIISELNIKGVHFSENLTLTGKIDMIKPIDGSNDVIVYDFKTGKPKSRSTIEGNTQSGNGDYKRQLIFYKILLDRYQFKKMKMVKGVIEFVEPNEKGVYKTEIFDISDDEVATLEQQIREITDEILSFGFWDKGCKKPECEYCVLRSYIENNRQ
jgi:DNA helicase II / ATP-dependent DNA helicase PcrA